jgi:cold shock CspA family protein
MQVPLQIAFHNMEGSAALKGLIEEKVAWLENFYGRITAGRVVVEAPHRQGKPYQVRVELTMPRGEVVVRRESAPHSEPTTLDSVIRDAFDAARRQLDDRARRHRHEVKSHQPIPHARVSRLFREEAYGVLETPDGREVYFHENAVLHDGFADLQVGAFVTFVETAGDKGPQASTVRLAH